MIKYDWSNKELLIENLKKSKSKADFLKNQKISLSSGNYFTFNKWIKIHNIDPNNYFKKKTFKEIKLNKYIVTDKDLSIESKITKNQLIKFINRNNIIKYECSCGNKGFWNNKPLTLQLEHKNGNNTDNRINNLEYLCPNCHSQTETYGSKNKHNRFFEKRINDLLKYNNKYLEKEDIIEISKIWKIKEVTTLNWIKLYHTKIKEYGVNLLMKEINAFFNGKFKRNEIIHNERIKDVKNLKNKTKKDYEFLALKWKITARSVKKWIYKNQKNF